MSEPANGPCCFFQPGLQRAAHLIVVPEVCNAVHAAQTCATSKAAPELAKACVSRHESAGTAGPTSSLCARCWALGPNTWAIMVSRYVLWRAGCTSRLRTRHMSPSVIAKPSPNRNFDTWHSTLTALTAAGQGQREGMQCHQESCLPWS